VEAILQNAEGAFSMPILQVKRKSPFPRDGAGSINPTRELYRECWCDEDGNVFTIVAWRGSSRLSPTFYTLDDGTPVEFKSHSAFRIVPTGELLFPCED